MALYKELAEKCGVERKSSVYIPDEALLFFVRLVIYNHRNDEDRKEGYIELGYIAGLFNGTGSVSSEAVLKYYTAITEKIEEIEKDFGVAKVEEKLGVAFKYVTKDTSNKNKM